jgi:hypothetical protein
MSVKVLLGGEELTDISRMTFRLSFRSGLETRDPNALEIVIDRRVGEKINDPADQLAFELLRGKNNKAGVQPFEASVELIDDNQQQPIGKWDLGEAFVAAMSTIDAGQRINEVVTLAANKIVYTYDGGPATPLLDITL